MLEGSRRAETCFVEKVPGAKQNTLDSNDNEAADERIVGKPRATRSLERASGSQPPCLEHDPMRVMR